MYKKLGMAALGAAAAYSASGRGRRSDGAFDTRRKAFPKKTHLFKDPSTSRVARVLRSGGFDAVTDDDYFVVVPGEQRGTRFVESGSSVRTGDPHHAQKLAVAWVYRGTYPRSPSTRGRRSASKTDPTPKLSTAIAALIMERYERWWTDRAMWTKWLKERFSDKTIYDLAPEPKLTTGVIVNYLTDPNYGNGLAGTEVEDLAETYRRWYTSLDWERKEALREKKGRWQSKMMGEKKRPLRAAIEKALKRMVERETLLTSYCISPQTNREARCYEPTPKLKRWWKAHARRGQIERGAPSAGGLNRGRRNAPTTAQRRKMGQKLMALPWRGASETYKKAHPEYKGIGGYPMDTLARASGARAYAISSYNAEKLTKGDVDTIFRRTSRKYPSLPKYDGIVCRKIRYRGMRRKCKSVTSR